MTYRWSAEMKWPEFLAVRNTRQRLDVEGELDEIAELAGGLGAEVTIYLNTN